MHPNNLNKGHHTVYNEYKNAKTSRFELLNQI